MSKQKTKKPKFYDISKILKYKADYNIIYGLRSNGKTHSILDIGLFGYHDDYFNYDGYLEGGTPFAIIRRYAENFKGKYGRQQFDGFINNAYDGNILYTKSKGRYNYIHYEGNKWYLWLVNEKGEVIDKDNNPFCYGFALANDEFYKSIAYPPINLVLFDEFLTRKYYIVDEFVTLMSVLSTIIRKRDGVTIFMCGNTVDMYSPYPREMGLTHMRTQKIGTIDLYTYGDSALKVAVEYVGDKAPQEKKSPSNKYFAFNNPKLKMVTSGTWELGIYPHLPKKYIPKNIIYMYFIKFESEVVQCEIISIGNMLFTYIHRKTTEIKDDGKYLVYQQTADARPNYRIRINKPRTNIERKIVDFFLKDKVFYQDNSVGELVRAYINWCGNL